MAPSASLPPTDSGGVGYAGYPEARMLGRRILAVRAFTLRFFGPKNHIGPQNDNRTTTRLIVNCRGVPSRPRDSFKEDFRFIVRPGQSQQKAGADPSLVPSQNFGTGLARDDNLKRGAALGVRSVADRTASEASLARTKAAAPRLRSGQASRRTPQHPYQPEHTGLGMRGEGSAQARQVAPLQTDISCGARGAQSAAGGCPYKENPRL